MATRDLFRQYLREIIVTILDPAWERGQEEVSGDDVRIALGIVNS